MGTSYQVFTVQRLNKLIKLITNTLQLLPTTVLDWTTTIIVQALFCRYMIVEFCTTAMVLFTGKGVYMYVGGAACMNNMSIGQKFTALPRSLK